MTEGAGMEMDELRELLDTACADDDEARGLTRFVVEVLKRPDGMQSLLDALRAEEEAEARELEAEIDALLDNLVAR